MYFLHIALACCNICKHKVILFSFHRISTIIMFDNYQLKIGNAKNNNCFLFYYLIILHNTLLPISERRPNKLHNKYKVLIYLEMKLNIARYYVFVLYMYGWFEPSAIFKSVWVGRNNSTHKNMPPKNNSLHCTRNATK